MTETAKKTEMTEAPAGRRLDPFAALRGDMDRFFKSPFEWGLGPRFPRLVCQETDEAMIVPDVDIAENDDAVTITAELPGMAEDDVDLLFDDGLLTIKGEKKSASEKTENDVKVTERRYGLFERAFRLPESVDQEKITASFDKGVLTVQAPKRPGETKKARRIAIG